MTHIQNSKQEHARGFTLVEMLISISIFMVFLGLVAGSYTQLTKANRRAKDMRQTATTAHFILDTLAQEIRTGSLDFNCLDPSRLDPNCLENQNGSGQKIIGILHDGGARRSLYKFDDAQKKILVLTQERASGSLPWSAASWTPLTPEKFPLENFSLRVFPLQDPYDSGSAANDAVQFQPSVRIALSAGGFSFQTTYSSRTYGRKSLYEK